MGRRPADVVPCGHPDRQIFARGACGPCYQQWWREQETIDLEPYDWASAARALADDVAAASPLLLSHLTAELVRRAAPLALT